jgi:hypothetical protein
MSTDTQTEYVAALTDLHRGLDRKGPGDFDFSRNILSNLSTLPLKPRIGQWVRLTCFGLKGLLIILDLSRLLKSGDRFLPTKALLSYLLLRNS